jgi:uncharacterized protein YigA (DUF484 family)
MIRHGQDNVVIADKLQRWTSELLLTRDAVALPGVIVEQIQAQFQVPQAAIRVWGVAPEWASQPFAQGVSADAQAFAASLTTPYCGANPGLEAASWLGESTEASAASLALLPLRGGPADKVFGLLVLGSTDPQRFHAGMGTDFLERIAELASAALGRLTAN